MAADPVSLAVFNSLFSSVAEEMGAAPMKQLPASGIRCDQRTSHNLTLSRFPRGSTHRVKSAAAK
mgnify:CR=1 FL=1